MFEQLGALEHLEAFSSLNGPRFYGLPVNQDFITLQRLPVAQPEEITLGNEAVVPFLAGETINWSVTDC
ncbi:Dihydroorotase [compost metagenome]